MKVVKRAPDVTLFVAVLAMLVSASSLVFSASFVIAHNDFHG